MGGYRIGVVGCTGRMGRSILRVLRRTEDCEIAGGSVRPGSGAVGQDIGGLVGDEPLGVLATADAVELVAKSDAIIDFSSPSVATSIAELAAQARANYVVGSTGLTDEQEDALQRAARHTAIVRAANMSVGVTLLSLLVEQAARVLPADYDIEILDMHHRNKVDAPSGTAIELARAAARGRGLPLDSTGSTAYDGRRRGPRPRGEVGFAVLRGGDVVGEHTVIFAGNGERIEFTHRVSSRDVFAAGAVRAALWARGKSPGLYSMRHVLGVASTDFQS